MATATLNENRNHSRDEDGELLDEVLRNPAADRDLLMMKMENETIMAECRVRPRDFAAIKKQLGDLLHNFPEFADDAIYARDVGDGKIAEDLSIRAAEALAEAYGWNRVRADITPIDADTVKVEAIFTDFQSGRVWQDAVIVSKYYTTSKSKGSKRARHSDDRFNDTVAKATKSKVIREVICRSVNPALKAWFKNECYKVQAQTVTPEKEAECIAAWQKIGVDLMSLEKLVGKPKSMGWLSSDLVRIRTLYVAVRDGETTVDALLAPPDEPAKPETIADLKAKIAGKGDLLPEAPFTPREVHERIRAFAGTKTELSSAVAGWCKGISDDDMPAIDEAVREKRESLKK